MYPRLVFCLIQQDTPFLNFSPYTRNKHTPLAVTAGNRGFLSIGDWLRCYQRDLIALFNPPKDRLPSYSTIRRVLLKLDYGQYSAALARFFDIEPLPGETLAVDGKVLRGSYQLESDNPESPSHPAILLVSAYLVERGLILEPYQNEFARL